MKDVKLVRRAKNGDKEAFAELYQMLYTDMYRFALSMLSDRYDAEDVVSETVMDAYKSIRLLKDEKLFKNWIFKILSNKCKRKMVTYYEKTTSIDEQENLIYKEVSETEEVVDLKRAFTELQYEEKIIVTYRVVQGFNSKEIGKMLNLNESTVRSKLSRALTKMKCRMEA